MSKTVESLAGRIALVLCHVAGVLVLVILPLWVGSLIGVYKLDPQLAGGLVTLYLIGIVISNATLAFRFDAVPARAVTTIGFMIPAAAFLLMTLFSEASIASMIPVFALLHILGGLGAGAGMAIVHGMIGRSPNPHRLFAFANFGVGVFGISFFVITPPMMAQIGINAVFINAGTTILIAALAALLAFPRSAAKGADVGERGASVAEVAPYRASTSILTICFFGVVLLQTGNAVSMSFVERIGNFRGFQPDSIGAMLAAGGLVALLAPIAATLLEKRISAIRAIIFGMLFLAMLSLVLFNSGTFAPYSVSYALSTATVLFTHTFAFGLLARYDPSGRMNALTTTMIMSGSAIGPFLGGTIAKFAGFPHIGMSAATCAVLGAMCYTAVASRQHRFR